MTEKTILKRDLFGEVTLESGDGEATIVRDIAAARWWLRWLARRLLAREARALAALDGIDGVPQLLAQQPDLLRRSFLAGEPLYRARPSDSAWFSAAARLLRRLHRAALIGPNGSGKTSSWPGTAGAARGCFALPPTRTSGTCSSTSAPIAPTC